MSNASPSETWQAEINPQFVQQLQERPARLQVIDPTLGQGLWSRSRFFHDRLSFFHQVAGRYLQANELPVESLPIVYAQPRTFPEAPSLPSEPLSQQNPSRRQQPLPITQPIQPASSQQNPSFVIQAKMADAHTTSAPSPAAMGISAPQIASIETPSLPSISQSLREDAPSELNFVQRSKTSEQSNPTVRNRQTAIHSNSSPTDYPTQSLPHFSPAQTVTPIVVSPSTKTRQRHRQRSLDVNSTIESSLPLVRPTRLSNQSEALGNGVLSEVHRARNASEIYPVVHSAIPSPISAKPLQPPISTHLILERLTQPTLLYPKTLEARAPESQPLWAQSNTANPLPLVFASTRSEPSPATSPTSAAYKHQPANFFTSNNVPAPSASAAAIAPAGTLPNPTQNPPPIDIDAVVAKVERKLMRQIVIERERRG